MATRASNSFSVGISTTPSSSMPTVADELATYALWGWTIDAAANPAYNSAGTYAITNPNIHGDTESDDVWNYLHAYNRRTTGRDGYKQRADAWRNYYVNNFEGSPEQNFDEQFLYDHFYGWGLQQYATQFPSDAGAAAEALKICTTLHDWWAAGGRSGGGNWPVAGNFDMAHYGHRGPARNLRTAVVVADATSNPKAIALRDRLIDLWLQSTDWDNVNGMYWVSGDAMVSYQVVPPLSYAAGDRAVSSFHIGLVAEAFFAAWLSPNVTAGRKTALRARIIAMATWMLHNGLDPTYRYCSDTLGIKNGGAGGAWWNYSLNGPTTSWDGSYTVSIVNLLVMAYKFTGDRNFLDATPANNLYPAKYCFNRGTKNYFGSTTLREGPGGSTVIGVVGGGAGNENVAYHLVDTRFDTSTGNVYLYNNKGELQYTYLIFENGGVPTVFP